MEEVYLQYVEKVKTDPEFELSDITDYILIENEDKFQQNLSQMNNANLSVKADLISLATKCLEKPEDATFIEVDDKRAFDEKLQYLRKLEVPIQNLERPVPKLPKPDVAKPT